MNIKQAVREFGKMSAQVKRELLNAERNNLALVKESMRHYSSGTNKAKRGEKLPVMPINIRSQQFLDNFKTRQPRTVGDTIQSAAWNDTEPYGKYLQDGTRNPDGSKWKMAPRPLVETVEREVSVMVERVRINAILKGFGQ